MMRLKYKLRDVVVPPNTANGIVNNEDPDQTAPLGIVCTGKGSLRYSFIYGICTVCSLLGFIQVEYCSM